MFADHKEKDPEMRSPFSLLPLSFLRNCSISAVLVLLIAVEPALAGRFVSIVETATFSPGEGELIQATAFSTFSSGTHREEALDLQLGVEYGLLRGIQVGFALPNVATVWTQETKSTKVGGTAMWGLFNLIDPETVGWGLTLAAIYGQGDDARTGELAFLAEKPLGSWTVVYNGTVGRSWARIQEFGQTDGMSHRLGASYQATGSVYLGAEGDWILESGPETSWETVGRYLGPNISMETGPLWITAAAHFAVGPGEIIPETVFHAQVGFPF